MIDELTNGGIDGFIVGFTDSLSESAFLNSADRFANAQFVNSSIRQSSITGLSQYAARFGPRVAATDLSHLRRRCATVRTVL
jgi:hypothetical protein